MGTNFVFFVKKQPKSRASLLERTDSGHLSIVSKFSSFQFTWICVKGMLGI